MMKKLYRWKSVAMEDYLDGDIIVMAESVEAARKAATAYYERYLMSNRFPYCFDDQGVFVGDQDDIDDLEDAREIFQEDLIDDPFEAIEGVILIRGSS